MPRDMTVAPTEMAIPALNSAVRTWSAVTCRPLDGWHRFLPNETGVSTDLRVLGPGGASLTLGDARGGGHDKGTLMRAAGHLMRGKRPAWCGSRTRPVGRREVTPELVTSPRWGEVLGVTEYVGW